MLRLLLGGARSGKSAIAVAVAARRGGPVCFVATAEALDGEMAERIALHRAERPTTWRTLEEPLELVGALERVTADELAVVDCATLWVANCLGAGRTDGEVEAEARHFARLAATRTAEVVVVTNEVGSGLVPADPLSRLFRDLLGRVNHVLAAAATEAHLVVAGRLLELSPPEGT